MYLEKGAPSDPWGARSVAAAMLPILMPGAATSPIPVNSSGANILHCLPCASIAEVFHTVALPVSMAVTNTHLMLLLRMSGFDPEGRGLRRVRWATSHIPAAPES